ILWWIALPTVMFGGFSLLRLVNRGNVLRPFSGELLSCGACTRGGAFGALASRLRLSRPDRPAPLLEAPGQYCVLSGILAQSGGFFLHMLVGRENQPHGDKSHHGRTSHPASAVAVLVYGLPA